jgi:hypothetical protein
LRLKAGASMSWHATAFDEAIPAGRQHAETAVRSELLTRRVCLRRAKQQHQQRQSSPSPTGCILSMRMRGSGECTVCGERGVTGVLGVRLYCVDCLFLILVESGLSKHRFQ